MRRLMSVANTNTHLNATTEETELPVSVLEFAPHNPASRTKDVESLRASLEESGQLMPIVAVDFGKSRYVVADGNRRLAASHQLGRKTIKAIVFRATDGNTDGLFNTLFTELNQPTRAFNGRDRLNAVLRGAPCFDSNTKSVALQLQTLFPEKEYQQLLVDREVTATVFSIAKKSVKYVLDGVSEDTPTFRNRLRNHILYLLRHPVQQPVTTYIRLRYDPEALKRAFDNDRPPPRVSTDRVKETWNKS